MNIEIANISKYYGRLRALNQISLRIEPGITGFLGPNGAGKTTLMQILTTIIKPTSGSVHCEEFTWDRQVTVQRNTGYLPQNFSYYPKLTVREALMHISVLKEIPMKIIHENIRDTIDRFNLQPVSDIGVCQDSCRKFFWELFTGLSHTSPGMDQSLISPVQRQGILERASS